LEGTSCYHVVGTLADACGGRAAQQRQQNEGVGTTVPERSDFSSDANPAMPGKNVMLAATISVGAVSAPVRIRTLSQDGAMVDGLTLPDAPL